MKSNYTIYFGAKPFYIVSELDENLYRLANTAGTLIGNQPSNGLICRLIQQMDLPGTKAVILLTNETKQYWKVFKKQFKSITAGGGVVLNDRNEVLFIFRKSKWDLPKGKQDEDETIEACAVREVKEETGLKKIILGDFLMNTYHTYREKGKLILKTSSWFMMHAPGNQKLTPQVEEEIEEMVWLAPENWENVFKNTYPVIPQILKTIHY